MFEVEDNKGLIVEPSVQAGTKGTWIYAESNNDVLAENIDYSTFCEDIIDLGLESKDEITFKKRYGEMLDELIR